MLKFLFFPLKFLKIFFLFSLFIIVLLFGILFYFISRNEKVVFNEDEAKNISYTPLVQLVPSNLLPANLKLFKSNNNLDIVQFKNKFYFAFRTSPTHFASNKTILYVLNIDKPKGLSLQLNNQKWNYETQFHFKDDLREPRFLVFKNKLFLYFFQGGSNPLSFAPKYIYVTEFMAAGKWTKPKKIYKPGFVIWRAKEHHGKAYMSVYYGTQLYSNDKDPGHLQLLESNDGYNYKLVNNSEVSIENSAEEGEFEFDNKGNLYATIRLEMKGGKVCFAKKENLTYWLCKYTPYKYDSALMFKHNNNFYVIARRSLDGVFNKKIIIAKDYFQKKQNFKNLIRYSLTRKRTTLYKLNKEKLQLEPIFDFPSKGDTAYAGITKLNENKYLLLNYSCDLNSFDWNWILGQLIGSKIYATVLEFKSTAKSFEWSPVIIKKINNP